MGVNQNLKTKTINMQRNTKLLFTLLTLIIFTATSCQAIGDIFKTGVWTGIILVVVVVAIIIWLISRTKK